MRKIKFPEQTHFDSGYPNGLSAVVHRFTEPGHLDVLFLADDAVAERVQLTVAPRASAIDDVPAAKTLKLRRATAARSTADDCCGSPGSPQRFVLESQGYVAFSAPLDQPTAVIGVRRATAERNDEAIFDSRRLSADDTFAVTMVRPGRYEMRNVLTKDEGTITVAYPVIGRGPYRPPDPVRVTCSSKGFKPRSIKLKPAQGIVFDFAVPSRIEIELVEPDDGPAKKPAARQGVRSIKKSRPQ
jgi:hypothetical protein